MSNNTPNLNDPLAFVRSMWSGMGITMPGMVTPTFDVDELEKRCLLYTSDAADERSSVDLGGRRIIKKQTTSE